MFATEHLICPLLYSSCAVICFLLQRKFFFELSRFWFKINVCLRIRAPVSFLESVVHTFPGRDEYISLRPIFGASTFIYAPNWAKQQNNQKNKKIRSHKTKVIVLLRMQLET